MRVAVFATVVRAAHEDPSIVELGARYDPIYWTESLATRRDQTRLRLCLLKISFHRYLALGVLKTNKQVYGVRIAAATALFN
jgi:hypothetical protein